MVKSPRSPLSTGVWRLWIMVVAKEAEKGNPDLSTHHLFLRELASRWSRDLAQGGKRTNSQQPSIALCALPLLLLLLPGRQLAAVWTDWPIPGPAVTVSVLLPNICRHLLACRTPSSTPPLLFDSHCGPTQSLP